MSGRVVPMRVGDLELLVETTTVPGSEPTSTLDRAGQRVVDGFDRAQEAIVELACSVAGTVSRLAARSARPDRVEVEFGLKFSVQGNVIVAGGSGEAALRVLVSYDVNSTAEPRRGQDLADGVGAPGDT